MLYFIIGFIIVLIIFYLVFIKYYPSFGATISNERKQRYSESTQFSSGLFHNKKPPQPSSSNDNAFGKLKIAYRYFLKKSPNSMPKHDLPVIKLDPIEIAKYKGSTRLFWYGHLLFYCKLKAKIYC